MAFSPLINGRRYSFASLEIAATIAGKGVEIFADVDDISYSEELEIAFRRGTSGTPLGWTQGNYNPGEATMQMGKSTFQRGIVEGIGAGWLGVNLTVAVKYSDHGEPLTVDTLIARIIGAEDAHSYGPDALVTMVTLQPFTILRNGIVPTLNRVF
jgi:hypothetical protein